MKHTCKQCNEEKSIEDFYKSVTKVDGTDMYKVVHNRKGTTHYIRTIKGNKICNECMVTKKKEYAKVSNDNRIEKYIEKRKKDGNPVVKQFTPDERVNQLEQAVEDILIEHESLLVTSIAKKMKCSSRTVLRILKRSQYHDMRTLRSVYDQHFK